MAYCDATPASIWFPTPPSVTTLPTAPTVTVNGSPAAANTAPLPGGWDPNDPDLCALFQTALPVGDPPVYPIELTTTTGLEPYIETVALDAFTTCVLAVQEFPYSLTPQADSGDFVTRSVVVMREVVLVPVPLTAFSLTAGTPVILTPVRVPATMFTLTALAPTVTVGTGSLTSILTLEFEGTDGSTTFTDLSASARTVTANGNAQIDTAQFNSGASSLYCGTAGSFAAESFASIAADTDFTVTTGSDFEARGSYRLSASDATTRQFALLYNLDTSSGIYVLDAASVMTIEIFTNGVLQAATGTITAPALSWHDIVVTKSGSTLTIDVNGTQVLSETATDLPWPFAHNGMRIGTVFSNAPAHWWIDDFEFSI